MHYALRHCRQLGIDAFAINTHHLPEAWVEFFPDKKYDGCPIEFFHEPVLLETGGGIRNIASFIGRDTTLVYNGDILTDINLQALIDHHSASGNIATLALRSTGDNCNVNLDVNRVIDMRNLLGSAPGTHQFTGIYCIEPEILNYIEDTGPVSIVPAFIELIKLKKLGAVTLDEGNWYDIGNPAAYHEVHRQLRQSRQDAIHPDAIISPDASVDQDTCIIGPGATIASGACLKDTIVWPNASVPANAKLNGDVVT